MVVDTHSLFKSDNLELAQSILNHIPTGLLVIDLDYTIVYLNDVYANYLNMDAKEIEGQKITDIFPDSGLPQVIRTGKAKYGAIRQISHENKAISEINLIVNRIPLCDKEGKIIGAMTMALLDTPEQMLTLISQAEKLSKADYKKSFKHKGFIANYSIDNILGESNVIHSVKQYLLKYAQTDAAVLILGETGTGKELTASAIHNASPRVNAPYVPLNCSAFPKELFESELFGYAQGAFSGAKKEGKAGLITIANGGTLFLDEVGELSLEFQAKLLRVLEDKKVYPVGADTPIAVDFRLVVATNKDLKSMVAEGTFREDLFYRINALTIILPPLSKRAEDIPIISQNILTQLNGDSVKCSDEAMRALVNWNWPGNIRELYNVLIRAISLCHNNTIELSDLPQEIVEHIDDENGRLTKSIQGHEAELIIHELQKNGWNVQKTAKSLGISRASLYEKMNKLKIKRNSVKA